MAKSTTCPAGIMNKIGVRLDRIHPVAVIVGDPKWLDLLASLATRHEYFSQYKAMRSMELEYDGQTFFGVSFGFGTTSLSRVVNELGIFGVRCILLITNSVSLVPGRVAPTEMCITYASCRGELTSAVEVDMSYPAVAHPDAVRALRRSAKELGMKVRLTRSYTCDNAYGTKIQRAHTLRDEMLQTSFELQDHEASAFLVECGIRKLVAGVITCNETEPCNFDQETGAVIEPQNFAEARLNTMRIALSAAAKLVIDYDFTEQS
ncbi:hypothetical protein X943_002745 [Babesia divergens]|uniref:Nucleoside phosphorylase domain-containing protein n=1 Tax=Babesia divergens TaxID=32595 RepID=A0AAD9LEC6_BABDI|nr:hypothetical protein X943_002745 [Babesia divergens]